MTLNCIRCFFAYIDFRQWRWRIYPLRCICVNCNNWMDVWYFSRRQRANDSAEPQFRNCKHLFCIVYLIALVLWSFLCTCTYTCSSGSWVYFPALIKAWNPAHHQLLCHYRLGVFTALNKTVHLSIFYISFVMLRKNISTFFVNH